MCRLEASPVPALGGTKQSGEFPMQRVEHVGHVASFWLPGFAPYIILGMKLLRRDFDTYPESS